MMPQPASTAPRDPAGLNRAVFVYGTLRAGGSNDIRRYWPAPRRIGAAVIAGCLYDFGDWPGLRLDGTGSVMGEVWRIDPSVEPLLDALEGIRPDGSGDYRKRQVAVQVGSHSINCLVYEIQADRIAGRALIPGGDWTRHVRSR